MTSDNPTDEVKSFLGTPCTVAPLLLGRETWSNEFARFLQEDQRVLVQLIGATLTKLAARASYGWEAIDRLLDTAKSTDDAQELEALLAVTADYALGTTRVVFDLESQVLAMLQQADLIAPSRQPVEAAHG